MIDASASIFGDKGLKHRLLFPLTLISLSKQTAYPNPSLLSRGEDLSKVMERAAKAAAITVSRPGAAESIPCADEV